MSNNSYKPSQIHPSEITPEQLYFNRRQFMKAAELLVGGAILAACVPGTSNSVPQTTSTPELPGLVSKTSDELGASLTPLEAITHYNNYYEFSEIKDYVADIVSKFKTSPWQVEVGGLVNNPKTYQMEDILKTFDQEERIYRLRCVEGWSMVIPWLGFPLAKILKEVEPKSEARFVGFISILRPEEMPGQKSPLYPWPYQEGLRLDEAMNDLTILATGLYGKSLPVQDGAPIRLVVPWKYGFKSIKTVVKIELVADQPATLWSSIAPEEYGFYSNVNPQRPHPRWSQATERRIGETNRQPTLIFNGYSDQVASLYAGMNLMQNY
jgi:methionine sulfoxide reductase catalytic subunit